MARTDPTTVAFEQDRSVDDRALAAEPVAATGDADLELARLAADAVPRRGHVPSAREARLGHQPAGTTFQPLPETEAVPRRSAREWLQEQREGLDYREITSRYGLRPLFVLALVRVLGGWDDAAFAVMLPEIRRDFGFDLQFMLTLGAVLGFVTTALAPAAGWLVDRVNRVRLLGISAVFSNAGSIALGLAGTIPQMVAIRVGTGLGGVVGGPASFPLLADWYPVKVRARVFGILGIAGTLGAVLGPLIGGGTAQLFGWRTALVGFGILGVLVSLALFTLPEPVRGYYDRLDAGAPDEAAEKEEDPMSWAECWRAAASIVTVRRLWYATPFLFVAGTGMQTLSLFYYAEEFGVGPFGRGVLASLGPVLGMVGIFVGAPMADRLIAHNPARVMVLFGMITLLGVIPVLVMVVSPWLWPVLVVGLPLGILGAIVGPAILILMSMLLPARMRGLGLQTWTPWTLLGMALMPVVGFMGDQFGLRGALLNLVPVYLIGSVILISSAGGVGRDIRAARAANLADEESRRSREEGRTKLLVCRDVDVTYDGTQVLFNVDFDVEDGELIALLGTNGAGKSTLLRAITGMQEASNGAIFLDGQDITHRPPMENARDGVVFVPGGRAIFPSLSVADNLRTAGYLYRDDPEAVAARTHEVLELFPSLRERLDEEAGNLSGGEQQMLALGQAFLMRPRLLMIDELSLGLAPAIVERLLEVVRRINAKGTTVILVEQSINVALTIARRAVFLEKGQVRYDGPTEELLHRTDLVRAVFLAGAGGGTQVTRRPRPGSTGEVERVLAVEGVHVSYGGVQALRGASVTVDAGQVVGIIGPNGAGKTTLFDVISGFVRPDEGTVVISGTDVRSMGPDARARLGLARSFQNARLFSSLTVRDAIAVALENHLQNRSAAAAALWLPQVARSERRVERRVAWLIELFGLEAFADKFVNELSTGSRRIVDFACIMASEPKVLLLDEPSSGLAQAESEALSPVVRRLARDAGCGVLVIEHDIPLVTSLADRMIAMELGQPIIEGTPEEVVEHPRVIEAYLGTDTTVVERSGPLAAALQAAGLAADPTRRTTS